MAKNVWNIDWVIALAIVGLMLFSISFVYSASASFSEVKFDSTEGLFLKHGIRVLLAMIVMVIMSRIDYHHIREFTRPLIFTAILLLVYVLIAGVSQKGASRWVNFGFINFQPTELAKFALLFHLSRLLAEKKDKIFDFKEGVLPPLLWIGAVCILIARQPNFSNAFVIFILGFTMIFLAGAKLWQLGALGITGLAAAAIFAVGAEYRMKRILAYIGAEGSSPSSSYQSNQAIFAFGNGGFFGVGPGQSRQRDWFLPEPYGDFIFSIVGEEYGYIGVVIVISCFALILWRGALVARKAPDDFGFFMAAGITATLTLYAFLNAGVTCGLLPTTGVPMPFISYGGTSILFTAAAVGILLNISSQGKKLPTK